MTEDQKLKANNWKLRLINFQLQSKLQSIQLDSERRLLEFELLKGSPEGSKFDWESFKVIPSKLKLVKEEVPLKDKEEKDGTNS